MYFSPLARRQYQSRHDGHLPQVALADLAFSTHAFLISLCTFSQVLWYARRTKTASGDERDRLIPTPEERNKLDFETSSTPSIPCRLAIAGIFIASLVSAFLVWIGKAEWLDWLYFASAVKLFVSVIKFMPQVILNWRLRSVEGFAIGQILAVNHFPRFHLGMLADWGNQDLTGSTFSFTQLVVSSLAIEHDPSGIFANPAKLGLAGVSLGFDLVFLVQKYWLFRGQTMERRSDSGDEDLGE